MKILITGGTGFIGSALVQCLCDENNEVTVLSRHPEVVAHMRRPKLRALSQLSDLQPQDHFDAVINLAGTPIFATRWTTERKKIITDSRVNLTEQLVASIARMDVKPEVLISGSAIGYYGNQGNTVLTEQSVSRRDFSQQLCQNWEHAALNAEALGVRVCLVRTGLVIAHGGGLLQRMLLPFRLGLGGRLGSGEQWMSWIHREDWLAIAQKLITDNTLRGVFNASAPHPVTNNEFTQTLAACLKRPALLPLPAVLLKMLLGEMSELVLGSQRVLPERLLQNGFVFRYNYLADALKQALA